MRKAYIPHPLTYWPLSKHRRESWNAIGENELPDQSSLTGPTLTLKRHYHHSKTPAYLLKRISVPQTDTAAPGVGPRLLVWIGGDPNDQEDLYRS